LVVSLQIQETITMSLIHKLFYPFLLVFPAPDRIRASRAETGSAADMSPKIGDLAIHQPPLAQGYRTAAGRANSRRRRRRTGFNEIPIR
jgi:hypothetical protein